MNVLVTFASRHAGTAEIADAVGEALSGAGHEVTVRPVNAVADVLSYDAVVLGSGVYMGRWLESARQFAEDHANALMARPTWLFSSGPLGAPPKPSEEPIDANEVAILVGAREHRVFPGRLDRTDLGYGEKLVLRVVNSPDGDYRPWADIAAWARGIAADLTATTPRR